MRLATLKMEQSLGAGHEEPDITVVAKWVKENIHDGGLSSSDQDWNFQIRQQNRINVRYSLSLSLIDTSKDSVFWRSKFPYAFDGHQLSEVRIESVIRELLQDFPIRGEKDSGMPAIE